jgi:voltage-gated potassium channel
VGSIPHLAEALFLVAATVAIHSTGTLSLLWCLHHYRQTGERHFGYVHNTAILTALVILLLFLHSLEVACWATFYQVKHCFPDFRTALYFSITSFSTVGYGDVVLVEEWRLLGGLEALTGMMMVSWSTVLLLRVCSWVYTRSLDAWRVDAENGAAHRGQPDFPVSLSNRE